MDSPVSGVFETKDRRDDFPIFIHSELDDYGLNPVEFRVYSRLARRAGQHGKHSESIPRMATEFGVSIRTVQRAIKLLLMCGLISRHSRPGKTDEYSLNPRSVWRDKKLLNQRREYILRGKSGDTGERGSGDTRDSGDMGDRPVVTPERGVVVTPESDEGTPFKGDPIKEINPAPKKRYKQKRSPKPEIPIPDDLRTFTSELQVIAEPFRRQGLDVALVHENFVARADRDGLMYKDWKGAFRVSLTNALKWAQRDGTLKHVANQPVTDRSAMEAELARKMGRTYAR